MSMFDLVYNQLVRQVINEGVAQDPSTVRAHYADGKPAPTISVEGVSFAITPEMGVPILQSKFVGHKWALTEIEWIWQEMSNDVAWLNDRGVTIWDSWVTPKNYYLKERTVVFIDKKDETFTFGEPKFNHNLLSNDPLDKKLEKHWNSMIKRVYAKTGRKVGFYRDKGVQVHPDWWDVNTFVQEVKALPNFIYKKNDWETFVLDKDYYGGHVYSKDTCVWLPQTENLLYQESVYPIKVTDTKGYSETHLGIASVSNKFNIPSSTVHRFVQKGVKLTGCKGKNARFNGYTFSTIPVPDGKLARLSLIEGTLGKAYGWQLGHKKRFVEACKMNQVEYVIHQLKHNPSSRRIMTTLWDVEDLDNMSLEPCVWATHWTVQEGKLNLHVKQRSSDICLGLPYNVLQYHALHALMAEEVGLELGTMYWNIDNAHIYERHVEKIKEQVDEGFTTEVLDAVPKLVLPEGRDFYDRRLSGAKIVDYKHNGTYTYEVAI